MRRVAVTTTVDAFDAWADPLTEAGFEPVALPCIEIRPTGELGRARLLAARADLLLLTSARTVRLMWPDGGMPTVPVAAVGSATARAARAAGGNVEVEGDGDGDVLVERLVGRVGGKVVVFPGAAAVNPARASRLAAMGARVVTIPVYETFLSPPAADRVDTACFGSPSAVRGWLLSRRFQELGVVAAIGPVTAAELERHGVVPLQPSIPSVEALASALSATQERSS